MGSVLRASQREYSSVFQLGCRGVITLVPSERIILFGSVMRMGMNTPTAVRARNAIYVPLPTEFDCEELLGAVECQKETVLTSECMF